MRGKLLILQKMIVHENFWLNVNTMVAEILQREFLCDIKIYFYSINISLYSIKCIYMISK